MFERYNEHSRRTLFFARYEALQATSPVIEPEHLLLGVLRQRAGDLLRFAHAGDTADAIRARLQATIGRGEHVSPAVEIPFSPACKLVLSQAAAEADDLGNHTIRPEHLILGTIAKANGPAARVLADAGVDANAIREYLRGAPDEPADRSEVRRSLIAHAVAVGGVVRQWKGVVKPGLAGRYLQHLHEETLPSLSRLDGFTGVTILHRSVEDGTEFQVSTIWRSLEVIKAFAGEDVTRAVVPPAAQALMVRFDDRAVHYEFVQ
jgi:heme-degrading monooxygenase HmoA